MTAILSFTAYGHDNDVPVSTLGVERLEDMRYARHSHAMIWTGDELVVIGGHTTGFVTTNTAEYYKDGHWHLIGPTLYPHDGAFILTYSDGRVLIGGGFAENFGVGRTFGMEWYDPATHHFSPAGILSRRRAFASALELPGGKIMVSGAWMGDDDIEVLDANCRVLYTKPVVSPRVSPLLLRTSEGDVKIIGNRADNNGWDGIMDALLSPAGPSGFPEDWRPMMAGRAYDESNHCIAPYTYILSARNKIDGKDALMKFEDGRFSLLESDRPFPETLPDRDSIYWCHEWMLTDKSSRCVYLPGCSFSGRMCFLKVDYNPALDGGKAAVSLFVSKDPLHSVYSEMNLVLLPGNRIAMTGGINRDNFEPFSAAYIFHLGDANPKTARSFHWLWILLTLAGLAAGVMAGWHLHRRRNNPEATVSITPEELEDLLMKRLISKMENERVFLHKGLTISALAKELSSNKTYISLILNRRRGVSFSVFVNSYRVDYAKRLMKENPSMLISDVADSAGFTDESSFFRNFKHITGRTPAAWRSSMANSN